MNRILLGVIATLVIISGLYFWISESRIGKLEKLTSAYKAQIAQQKQTIKAYNDRLVLVQDSVKKYQTTYQDIQGQVATLHLETTKANVPLLGLTDSQKASETATSHFNSMFQNLNAATAPEVKK